MRGAGQVRVVVEAARDHRHTDGGSLETRHPVLVASELRDVAPVADVPASNLATASDRLLCLFDETFADGSRRVSPFFGLARGPRLLQPVAHGVEDITE